MKLLKLAFQRETAIPMLGLTFASAASVALVVARILWAGNPRYMFLIWNLFLAWLPLVFALLACDRYRHNAPRNWHFLGLAGAWLLFFPNAPYICTDIIHLHYLPQFWVDLVLILLCALTGLVVGFVSLYLMQTVVARAFGHFAGWCFIAGVAALAGFGICLGRFLRFNSWDLFFKPVKLYHGLGNLVVDPFANPGAYALPVLFAVFLFIVYVMLYALTHLQPARLTAWTPQPNAAP